MSTGVSWIFLCKTFKVWSIMQMKFKLKAKQFTLDSKQQFHNTFDQHSSIKLCFFLFTKDGIGLIPKNIFQSDICLLLTYYVFVFVQYTKYLRMNECCLLCQWGNIQTISLRFSRSKETTNAILDILKENILVIMEHKYTCYYVVSEWVVVA